MPCLTCFPETDYPPFIAVTAWPKRATTAAFIFGVARATAIAITQRVKELAERYETPLPQMASRVGELEAKVNHHLEKMGFAWK